MCIAGVLSRDLLELEGAQSLSLSWSNQLQYLQAKEEHVSAGRDGESSSSY